MEKKTENENYLAQALLEFIGEAQHDLEVLKHYYYGIEDASLEYAETALEESIFNMYDEMFFTGRELDEAVREEGKRLYRYATELVEKGEYDEAGKLFRKAALCGNVYAQFDCGVSVANGEGCEKNELESCYWFWKAANENHAGAMINLGINYREGSGVRKNLWKMLQMYARAAYLLDSYGVYNLGCSLKEEEVIIGKQELGQALIGLTKELEDKTVAESVQAIALSVMNIVQARLQPEESKISISSEKLMDLSSDFYLLSKEDKDYVKKYFSHLIYDLAAVVSDCNDSEGGVTESAKAYIISTYVHINTLLLFMALNSAPVEQAEDDMKRDIVILIVNSYLDAIGDAEFYNKLAIYTGIEDANFRKLCIKKYSDNIENTLLSVKNDFPEFLE